MSSEGKSRLVKYGVTAAVGLVLAAAVLYLQGFFGAEGAVERVRILADAFTVPGALMLLVSGLIFASNQGALDGISYALKSAAAYLIPGMALERHERYGDYVERKRKRGGVKGYRFLPITGGVFLGIAVILIIVFYQMGG